MWPFRKHKVIKPFDAFLSKMRKKDPELYERIKWLPVGQARRIWQQHHAEDFPQNRFYIYWPYAAS